MATQEKHERLVDACLNDAAVQRTVHIDACLAPGILGAELCSSRATKRVAEYSHVRHVEPTRELAGWVRGIQPLQLIKHEGDVGGPRGQQLIGETGQFLSRKEFRVVLWPPRDHPAIRENDQSS